MRLASNMGRGHRLFYVVAGIGALVTALVAPLDRPWPALLLVFGVLAVVEASAGF